MSDCKMQPDCVCESSEFSLKIKAEQVLRLAQGLLSKYETEKSEKQRDTIAISFQKTMKQYEKMLKIK